MSNQKLAALLTEAAGRDPPGEPVRHRTSTATDLLTAREREVMDCIAEGLSDDEAARQLWIARGTVRKHLEHIYEKLGVGSRTAALAKLR